MNPTTAAIVRALVRAARPWPVLAGVLLYALGGGIARYLGNTIDWPAYFTGQALMTMLQLSGNFLREYFDRASQPPFEQVARKQPPPDQLRQGADDSQPAETVEIIVPRLVFFQAAAVTLTTGAVMAVLEITAQRMTPVAALFLALAAVLVLLYAVPPFRLVYSGYGELVQAILLANLFPALAFIFQVGDLHRLLGLLTFPLTLMVLAGDLARGLRGYYADYKENRQTMLVRLGWQRGMTLHNVLIAVAFLALAAAVIAGIPARLVLPAFLALPVGIFQIWQMTRIAAGAPPRWRVLDYTAIASVALMAYFLALTLWIG